MRTAPILLCLLSALAVSPVKAEPDTVCTAVMDVTSGASILREGNCEHRITPASTFKIAISLMGYDAGTLVDEKRPALPFKKGYADWNPAWRETTTPESWMKKSVVWYSQQITQSLGEAKFRHYVKAFAYGNGDISGHPGRRDGLTAAWLSSSLQISPLEQLDFLRRIVRRALPVSAHAYDMTATILDVGRQPNGWYVFGKTGAGGPRKADGNQDSHRMFGWFVGWATKGDRSIVFVRLVQNTGREAVSPGLQARDAVMRDLFSASASL